MGRWSMYSQVTENPAANVEIAYRFTENVRIHGFCAKLTTDAGVADRQVRFTVEGAPVDSTSLIGNVYFQSYGIDVHTASLAYTYCAVPMGIASALEELDALIKQVAWPIGGIFVPKDGMIRTITALREATDNWDAMTLLLERA